MAVNAGPPEVVHRREQRRFELDVDGGVCELDYVLESIEGRRQMRIVHTGVPERLRHRGLAAQLTVAALTFAEAETLAVVPQCSYAAAFLRRHAEWQQRITVY